MKEKNHDRLRRALGQLPEYDAPDRLWAGLRKDLDHHRDQAGKALDNRLPSYAPPAQVWNAVSRELNAVPAAGTKVPRLAPRQWLALAATVVFLLSAGATVLWYDAGPQITYAYSQEPAPQPVVADWDADESSFTRALAEVRTRNEPILNNLGQELDELTSAREEVKAMLVAYGEDPGIVRQLADIERERDDVYRRIIVEL